MLYQHTNVRASECGMSPNFHAPALLVLSILQVFTSRKVYAAWSAGGEPSAVVRWQ